MPSITNPLLDVVVGLALSFFVLSLAPSAIVELLATFTRIRSKFLWAYLNQLFTTAAGSVAAAAPAADGSGRKASTGKIFTKSSDLTAREMVRATTPTRKDVSNSATSRADARPVPVSFRHFGRLAIASDDLDPRPKNRAHGTEAVEQLHGLLRPIGMGSALRGNASEKRTTIKHVPIPSLVQALIEMLLTGEKAGDFATDVQTSIDKWEGTPIHPTLTTMWLAAGADVAAFRAAIEHWFDAEMDRLSGLYKRLLRWVVVFLAAVVALAVNLNPLALASDLWHDAARRTQAVSTASSMTDTTPGTKDSLQDLLAECKKSPKKSNESEKPKDIGSAIAKAETCVIGALDQAKSLNLTGHAVWGGRWSSAWSRTGFIEHLFGLAILTGALAMGAPFWFDILRRVMGIRASLQRRET